MKIGVVGTESTHVDHMVRYCNVEHRAGDTRIVAVAEATRGVGVERVVDRAEDLIGSIDAVIVADRDGRRHAAQAIPLLRAGLPTFVDKPLAASVADAEEIVRAAERSGAPLTSFSALRWHPTFTALTAEPRPSAVVTTGPVDPDSPYAGIFFYGIHPVELALILAPGRIGDIHVSQSPDAIVAVAEVGEIAVTTRFIRPGDKSVPFHVMTTTTSAVRTVELPLGPAYFHPVMDAFLAMIETGVPPISYDDLLRPVRFLASVAATIRSS